MSRLWQAWRSGSLGVALMFGGAVGVHAGPLASVSTEHRVPFVTRIQLADYFAAETFFAEAFSRTHDLVFLRFDNAKPASALMLAETHPGETTVTLRAAPLQAGGEWVTASTTIDSAVARQIARAVEFKLHRNVDIAPLRVTVASDNAALWIFQRTATEIAAAVIDWDSVQSSAEAKEFIDGIVDRLTRLVGAEGAERTEQLRQLDVLATRIVLTESSK